MGADWSGAYTPNVEMGLSEKDKYDYYYKDEEAQRSFLEEQRLSQSQQEYQKELMSLQYLNQIGLNKDGLKNSKELYEFTTKNADRFKAEGLEAAGMNRALMYGGSGPGGTASGSSGGSAASGNARQQNNTAAAKEANSIQERLGAMQIGLQMQQVASQSKLNDAQANKANAEAERVSGSQTDLDRAEIDKKVAESTTERERAQLVKVQTRVENSVENLNYAHGDYLDSQANKVQIELKQLEEIITGLNLDNQLKADTYESRVQDAAVEVARKLVEIKTGEKDVQVSDARIASMREEIKQKWTDVLTKQQGSDADWAKLKLNEKELEIMAQKVLNELNLGEGKNIVGGSAAAIKFLEVAGQIYMGGARLKRLGR